MAAKLGSRAPRDRLGALRGTLRTRSDRRLGHALDEPPKVTAGKRAATELLWDGRRALSELLAGSQVKYPISSRWPQRDERTSPPTIRAPVSACEYARLNALGGPIVTAPGRREGGRILILVVERDPHVRELERYLLEDAGFDVEFAADGMDALTIARAVRPDIVISEILVPRLDGLALCREIRRDSDLRGATVLIFSVLSAAVRAKEAGADAFLRKPLAERSLVTCVQQLLAAREKSA